MHKLLRLSFSRYAIVGASGFLIDYVVFITVLAMVKNAQINTFAEGIANGLGMLAGAVWCYFFNRTWSFKSNGKITAEAARYTVLLGFNAVVSSVALKWICAQWDLKPWLVKIPIMGIVFIWNYFVARFWVFRQEKGIGVSDYSN